MACTTVEELVGNEPVVDMKGVNIALFEADMADCEGYADQVSVGRKTASSTATGGAVGAVFGDSRSAKMGAGAGAVTGSIRGDSIGMNERQQVLGNCLAGRGSFVLN